MFFQSNKNKKIHQNFEPISPEWGSVDTMLDSIQRQNQLDPIRTDRHNILMDLFIYQIKNKIFFLLIFIFGCHLAKLYKHGNTPINSLTVTHL